MYLGAIVLKVASGSSRWTSFHKISLEPGRTKYGFTFLSEILKKRNY
jgi:hypothetical protein